MIAIWNGLKAALLAPLGPLRRRRARREVAAWLDTAEVAARHGMTSLAAVAAAEAAYWAKRAGGMPSGDR